MEKENNLKYTTILWDFHGVFTNNKAREAHAANLAFLEALKRPIKKEEYLELSQRPEGVTGTESLKNIMTNLCSPDELSDALRVFKIKRDELYIPKHIYMIRKIKELGAKCAVVTNGQEKVVKQILHGWGVLADLEEVYGRGTGSSLVKSGVPEKPSPEVIDYVVGDLRKKGISVRRDKTLMLGDYKDDVGASNSSGVHSAFLVTGPNQKPEYYSFRPTYSLIDRHTLEPYSDWFKIENTHSFYDLPKIVKGVI